MIKIVRYNTISPIMKPVAIVSIIFGVIAIALAYMAISFDINHLLPRGVVLDRNAKQAFDGIDVSHHQGTIDWKKVKQAQPELEFVYVKCSEGKTYVDPQFIVNARGFGTRIQCGCLPLLSYDK